MAEQKIVIIGGGIAGLSAAQAARETDPEAVIYLSCGEGRLPYYRPRICELFSGGDVSKLAVHNEQWFASNQIETLMLRATAINTEQRQVKFADGSHLNYDKLILATGAKGNLPEARGNDRDNVRALRFLADIEHIQAIPGPAVIVGDGLLGLEAAWHLSREGRDVTIIGRGDRLLARQLDREGSVFFLGVVENAGLHVALNGNLEYIDDQHAVLADGRAFEAGAVIFAAGIKSVYQLGQNMGLDCGRAIVVDDHMRASLPDVFAAGDCAEYQGRTIGLWTASMAQGTVAGVNAAGGDKVYVPEQPAYLMNAMGTRIWSFGNIEAEDGASCKDPAAAKFAKFFFADGKLVGAELIGDTQPMVKLKKMVESGAAREEALASIPCAEKYSELA